jgi:hypothetical protein
MPIRANREEYKERTKVKLTKEITTAEFRLGNYKKILTGRLVGLIDHATYKAVYKAIHMGLEDVTRKISTAESIWPIAADFKRGMRFVMIVDGSGSDLDYIGRQILISEEVKLGYRYNQADIKVDCHGKISYTLSYY